MIEPKIRADLKTGIEALVRAVMTDPQNIESMVHEALLLAESDGTGRFSITVDIRQAREAEFVVMAIPSIRSIPHSPRVRHLVRTGAPPIRIEL